MDTEIGWGKGKERADTAQNESEVHRIDSAHKVHESGAEEDTTGLENGDQDGFGEVLFDELVR